MTESRALGAGLLASLLINAFFVGVMVTRWTLGGPPPPPGLPGVAPPPALDLGRIAAALPPPLRPKVDEAFRERRRGMGKDMGVLLEQRRRVRAALETEPFDPDVLRAELQRLRELHGAVAQHAHDALVDLAGRLDADGRRTLAEAMNRRPPPRAGAPLRPAPGEVEPLPSRAP